MRSLSLNKLSLLRYLPKRFGITSTMKTSADIRPSAHNQEVRPQTTASTSQPLEVPPLDSTRMPQRAVLELNGASAQRLASWLTNGASLDPLLESPDLTLQISKMRVDAGLKVPVALSPIDDQLFATLQKFKDQWSTQKPHDEFELMYRVICTKTPEESRKIAAESVLNGGKESSDPAPGVCIGDASYVGDLVIGSVKNQSPSMVLFIYDKKMLEPLTAEEAQYNLADPRFAIYGHKAKAGHALSEALLGSLVLNFNE